MPTSPKAFGCASALRLAGAGALLLAGAGVAQDRPESILPPGFGDPAPVPTPTPAPTARPTPLPGGGLVQPIPPQSGAPRTAPSPSASLTPTATPSPIDPAILAEYEMPASARRSLSLIGPAGPREGALGAESWRGADGTFLQGLMRRMDAPLPSRWASILLRRALTAQATTPANVNGADFAAERAWLLIRMGEAQAARAVAQGVDPGDYTPKLYQVAMNAMLAAGDPAGLCPLADEGVAATGERGWTMAQGMCAGLAGEPGRGAALLTAARRRRVASGVDLLLAQKVIGAAGGRQAITIEWDGVDRLTAWRWGLASATGVAVPPELMAGAGRQVMFWRATAPTLPLADRIEAAEAAAAGGVLSARALVDLYGAVAADDDAPAAASAVADDLRTAYVGRDVEARAQALRAVWGEGRPSYARLLLTARAAARVRARADHPDADRLIAAMLGVGMDRTAARWRGVVAEGSDGWAMLAVGDPDARGSLSYGDLASYAGSGDAAVKQRLFFAGLAGLGRLSADDVERGAEALNVRIGTENSWTRAIDRAAATGQQGTVALLAGVGMQTTSWGAVPPEALYRIVGALRAVGLGGEARMIAAEAIARA
ncbi:hypothetical protein [uncultured Sphingomonas sp.]|uniref:hypothetical protein n=1 Tax=uncultured Sphingomonas sp. TaxID=158754 RepID=UPI0035CB3AE4